ncbi:nitronate monooxygenase [Nocardia puris]|uniref:Nitronate monooxygenase n=1 Tax=Nocardia puris TaxID=208602 RepID=A0A366DDW8_9NOCA|nr:nitronate monooxygenase [Nocardia puris]MBF6215001.1 nitronate monooxygenase [Nocardia puris]MBF6367232.1 nitronate monooxygenase [Nocardia puris]MBF6461791.1 nitronate monooxygenase [Nocardia puris]RBO88247.1 nitronate monooxygenase [Nocardia puris]
MSRPVPTDPLAGRVPLVNAPMGGAAGGALAGAVSAAGGLGMIGMGSSGTRAALSRELDRVPEGVRVGIGVVDWVVRREPALLDLALESGPLLLSVSFGTELDWIARAHAAGIPTAVQVADTAEAEAAHRAGADLLVARGQEGGGHGRPLHNRDTLLANVLRVTDRPVLAAGAIATATDVSHVLSLGAAGVWVGTAFTACREALTTPGERAALLAADGENTLLTSIFDQAAGYPWPPDLPERVLANDFTRRWSTGLTDLPTATAELHRALTADDPRNRPVNAGLGVGNLTEETSAAEVVRRLAPR